MMQRAEVFIHLMLVALVMATIVYVTAFGVP
jgi:hypothetical protein